MECPKCKKGAIRVQTEVVCSCGHHPLLCDDCFAIFTVACGPPFGSAALPPELEMTEDEYAEPLAAVFRMQYEEQPSTMPTLEDFTQALADGTFTPPSLDDPDS